MNLDKSTKRIAKRVSKGFQGYPQISLSYFGESADLATEVIVGFILEEGLPIGQFRLEKKIDNSLVVFKDSMALQTVVQIITNSEQLRVLGEMF